MNSVGIADFFQVTSFLERIYYFAHIAGAPVSMKRWFRQQRCFSKCEPERQQHEAINKYLYFIKLPIRHLEPDTNEYQPDNIRGGVPSLKKSQQTTARFTLRQQFGWAPFLYGVDKFARAVEGSNQTSIMDLYIRNSHKHYMSCCVAPIFHFECFKEYITNNLRSLVLFLPLSKLLTEKKGGSSRK
jgi:hypothetical protein